MRAGQACISPPASSERISVILGRGAPLPPSLSSNGNQPGRSSLGCAHTTPAAEFGLLKATAIDDQFPDALVQHAILVNRPVAVTPKGTRLRRPFQAMLEVLDRQRRASRKRSAKS